MTTQSSQITALEFWQSVLELSGQMLPVDLSSRQMNIMLKVYLSPGPHSVKTLSETLEIPKAAICRAIDTLSENGLVKRKRDEEDKRNVYIQRTVRGSVFLSEFSDLIQEKQQALVMEPA